MTLNIDSIIFTQEDGMERSGDLVKGKFKQYLLSTLSMSAALYLAVMVDSVLVGNILGSNQLAAVNLCNPIAFISNSIFCILIYGGSTAAAMHLGGRDKAGANSAFTLSVLLCLGIQLVFAAVGLILRQQIAGLLSHGGELAPLCEEYLVPLLAGIPIIGLSSGVVAFARLDGFTGLSSAIPIVANVINLVLDYVFMKLMGFGIASAGWATVIGYSVGALMLIPYFVSKKRGFRFTKALQGARQLIREIVAKGLPTSLTNVCSFVRAAVVNSLLLATSGSLGVQIMAVCTNAAALSSITAQGVGNTILPVAGALYGEKDKRGIVYTFRYAMLISLIITAVLVALLEAYAYKIDNLFGLSDPAEFIPAFSIYVTSFLLVNVTYQFKSLYQATGNQKTASVITVIEGAAVIVPLFIIISKLCPSLIWASFTLAEALSIIIIAFYTCRVAKKNKLSRVLLLGFEKDEKLLDVTIKNSVEKAEELSQQLMRFCEENSVEAKKAMLIAAAAEEMTVNIAKYAYPKAKQDIDVTLRILEQSMVLKIRDDGAIFNPLKAEPREDGELSGIEFVKKISSGFTYNRVLGFNVTVITINK